MRNFRATYYCKPSLGGIGPQQKLVDFPAKSGALARILASEAVLSNATPYVRLVSLVEFLGTVGDYQNAKVLK